MFPRTHCPYCSYPLLLHSSSGKPYWFCCHCYQDVPYGIDRTSTLEQSPQQSPKKSLQQSLQQSPEQLEACSSTQPVSANGDRHPDLPADILQHPQVDLQLELAKLEQLKEDFLNTTSHELRTPLSNMRLAIQMLDRLLRQEGVLTSEQVDTGTNPARISDYLKLLRDECEQEIGLINDLLVLQQIEAGTQSLLPMQLLLQDWILQMVAPFEAQMLSRQQRLRIDIPSNLPPLTTDFTLLDRLLSELLHNACRFTPKGEQITVAASASAGRLQIQVINSGVEIAESELTRIFDKFYRVPTDDPWQHQGTGLGLALAKALALYLDGTIWAKHQSGQTCFTVELPCRESQEITYKDVLMSYVAYYLSRGKTVLSPRQGTLPFEGEVYHYWGYHRDFLDFWHQLLQRPDFSELYLQGDNHAFRQFLGGECMVTECARCRLPIPTESGHVYSTPNCLLCHDPVVSENQQGKASKRCIEKESENETGITHVLAIGKQCHPDASLQTSLRANGFEVTFVSDPNVITLDVLPSSVNLILINADIAESEAQAWARQLDCYPQLRGVQIVALSCQNRFSHPWTDRQLGVEDYLLSPLGGDRLAHQLRQVLPQPLTAGASQLHWFPC
ncbi:MAG: HAMP domain-containing histidine kinase [Oscillatoriophycideae cyanobacterium NC_groundwater_1537_Pr4_S-0.65um_50_18]|nr:HAMP domain-containing histidine kinase [Oscillatoriophycideae cyanobacterium NC_groundwater_1537_Pr4_S-0.65um_50_18]